MVRKRVVNVVDLGADPSGRTDSREAFRKAIEDIGASVLVPMGTYRISGMIRGDASDAETPPAPNVTDSLEVEASTPEDG